MDASGHIYELSKAETAALGGEREVDQEQLAEVREDVARLDGYLRGRAESDRPKRGPGSNRDLAG